MAVDIYDSQYLLILAPSLVIALMFFFFWLFMKETSYDEVLAKQKRDLKLPPAKPDTRKKMDKKKSKKKESAAVGGGGGGGGESEEDVRDFDLADGANSSSLEMDEEPALESTPVPAEPIPVHVQPVSTEPPTGLRERKKKEKKAAKAAAVAAAALSPATMVSPEQAEINGAKLVSRTADPPPAESKRSSLPSPQIQVEVQAAAPGQIQQTPPQSSGKKKKKQKAEPVSMDSQLQEVKPEQAPVKNEAPIVAETKAIDGAAPPATGGKKKNAKKQKTEPVEEPLADSPTPANHQTTNNENAPPKSSSKKQKNETDKENSGVKLKELLSGLSSLVLSDAEAVNVLTILGEKSPNAVNAWHKSAAKPDPAEQERERLLITLQEEASIAKDKVKQLSQELQVEKQKTGRVEAMMRDQRAAMEKELGGMQAKAQGSYQEVQTMQMKYQQVREQLESQITRLQQENGILRDAVSSATNQMESKNSAELNKLRSEYAALRNELADNKSKLQQEEHQRVSLEVSYKQNVSQLEAQLQEAKRRWEEVQNFLHTVNAEREKLQASKQDLHTQLLAVETEMNNKNKEVQTLHGSLTEAMVSKEGLEKRVMELLEASQHSTPDDAMQARVQDLMNENKNLQVQSEMLQAQISSQANHVSHIEELQKLLADKELQRKSLEDSLNAERSSGASRETDMQALHNENMTLKAEMQNLQAQLSEQTASQVALDQFQKGVQEREESIKTVEGLLEKGLIEVANKEEELKALREENKSLKQELDALKQLEQASSESTVQDYQSQIQELEMKVKSLQDTLQTAQDSSSAQEKRAESLEQQLSALQTETELLRQKEVPEETDTYTAQLQDVQQQLMAKDKEIQKLEAELEMKTKEMREKMEQQQQQSLTAVPSPEQLGELSEKEKQISDLQGELAELRNSVELHRRKNNENEAALVSTQAKCRDVLHRLLPHVPLPPEQNHQEWICKFENAVSETPAAQPTPASGDEELADKLKEAEESQRILQKDCETYKKVLAETEGILQRLQSSVEQEESRWKLKLEMSQEEMRDMHQKVTELEQEIERLTEGGELENLRREKQHLESELERAERESATYVTEVRELRDLLTELQTRLDGSYTEAIRQNEELNLLKTQLTETLSRLETEETERQQVAADLYKAQQSLDLIQGELSKVSDNADELIENSTVSSENETERKEKMTAGLNQTVRELQQLLQGVSHQLSKGLEGEANKDFPKV